MPNQRAKGIPLLYPHPMNFTDDAVEEARPKESVQHHKRGGRLASLSGQVEDLQQQISEITDQLGSVTEAASKNSPKGYELDTITFSLGIDAEGKVGFIPIIAEGKISAKTSITLTFNRRKTDKPNS